MRVIASPAAESLVQESGGRLYVWPSRARCCGAVTRLASSARKPEGRDFRLAATAPFDVFVPTGLARLPAELEVDVARFPRRVEAYWNGCAWIV